ncbi:ABC transporter permease subunit [Bacillus salitolerans]|uniref:ABC transporter permease subunit n=1 Tax=Bacillus salitolerans TaxID=1437434 RepID=A0ABW4LQS6_9BACI
MRRLSVAFVERGIITLIGLIFLGSSPAIFTLNSEIRIDLMGYFGQIVETIKLFFSNPLEITYYASGVERTLLPSMLGPYLYSLTILISALILSIIFSVLLSYIQVILPRRLSAYYKSFITVLNSAPDVLIIVLLQLLIIAIYKKTDILLFNIISLYDNPTYVLPIICLSIAPTIHLTKMVSLYINEEKNKNYILLAKGKGFSSHRVILIHILRNVLLKIVSHFRSHFVFMLSNLFVLEYIFNIYGITNFLYKYGTANSEVLTVGLILICLPTQILLGIIEWLIKLIFKGGMTVEKI